MLHSNKICILTCALLTTIALQSSAMEEKRMMQNDSSSNVPPVRHAGFISPGIAWINVDDINDYLATMGIASFKTVTPTLSIGGSKEIHDFIFESAVTLRYWKNNVNSNLRTSLFAGDVTWNCGYNVLPQTVRATFFPYAGIGAGLNSLRIRKDKMTTSEVFTVASTDAMIWQTMFLLTVGAGADIQLHMKDASRGMILGIRGGCTFDPFTKDRNWYSKGSTVENGPKLKQNSAYIRLIFGSIRHHRHHPRRTTID